MATIIRRPGKNGQTSYRAQVRRKGAPTLSATFTKLSDAHKWIQVTEAAIVEGRHFKTAEAKRHTLADAIDRPGYFQRRLGRSFSERLDRRFGDSQVHIKRGEEVHPFETEVGVAAGVCVLGWLEVLLQALMC